jgi:integrase
MALTETSIRKLKDPAKEKLIGDERGLYLRCYPSGRRSWLYRSRKGGTWKTRNLGEWPGVSLSEARSKAAELDKRTLPESVTFGAMLDEWFQRRIEPRYKVTKNIEVYVSRGKAEAGNTPLSQLTTKRLTDILVEYADDAPVAANRCLSNWKLALKYAVERGYIERSPLENTTSAVAGGEEKSRDRVLSDAEIKALWKDQHDHAPLLKFLLLTGLRISEAQSATHDNLNGDVLAIPENKSSRPHWVYLPPMAKELTGNHDGYLFAQRSNTAVQARLRNTAKVTWTPHDLRRTFATRLAGLGVDPLVVEKMLNHTLGGVLATYNRHAYEDERKDAAVLWATELHRLIGGEQ